LLVVRENKKNHQKGKMDQNEKGAGAMNASNEGKEFLLASSDTVFVGCAMMETIKLNSVPQD